VKSSPATTFVAHVRVICVGTVLVGGGREAPKFIELAALHPEDVARSFGADIL
jgi:tetraacyldisaccharide-1-P 4'-kinase